MSEILQLGSLKVEILRKRVRNINLAVLPPSGRVRVSASRRVSQNTIRQFVFSKLSWITKSQKEIKARDYPTGLRYIEGETHMLWGEPYTLHFERGLFPVQTFIDGQSLVISTTRAPSRKQAGEILEQWYRHQIRLAAVPLIAKWEPIMGVRVKSFTVQSMKTLWGSCTPSLQTIRLNAQLAKRSAEYLEYIVVHEMVHLLEASHNWRFKALMDRFMPQWRTYSDQLNGKAPLASCA